MLRIIAIVVGLVVGAGCLSATSANKDKTGIAAEYLNPGRTFFERVVTLPETGEIMWQAGNLYPKQPDSKQKESLSFAEITSEPMHICSDEMYRCVYSVFRVFAVPRAGFTNISTYSVGGAALRMEHCLRGDSKHCQVALISSDCQKQSGSDSCEKVVGGRQQSTAPGPILYFIYNEDFGVTSYGSVEEFLQTENTRTTAASKWILKGDKGLLAD